EEGTEADVPGQEFGLVVGAPAEFRFLSSTVRREDPVGTLVEEWEGQVEESTPMRTTLEASSGQGRIVPVHLHSRVTERGARERGEAALEAGVQRPRAEGVTTLPPPCSRDAAAEPSSAGALRCRVAATPAFVALVDPDDLGPVLAGELAGVLADPREQVTRPG